MTFNLEITVLFMIMFDLISLFASARGHRFGEPENFLNRVRGVLKPSD